MKKFIIFQLRHDCPDYRLKSYAPLKWLDSAPNLADYNNVYEGEIEDGEDKVLCERIFARFNMNRPNDFEGHSLSVADIVSINGNNYYCDDYGFVLVA